MERAEREYGLSERHACRLLGQGRGTQRYEPIHRLDEEELRRAVIALASQYGRYGYRRITALLRSAGWLVGQDRVQRIWRREGLKVPQKQRPRRRLWLNDGSCIRLRPERPNHVWSYDFVSDRTEEGRTVRILALMDEYTRESLAIKPGQSLKGPDVVRVLQGLPKDRGGPKRLFCDNGSEFSSQVLDLWAYQNGVKIDFSRPGKPTDNGHIESFNGTFRDECLNTHWFTTLGDAREIIEAWRREYNESRPHRALGERTPYEFAFQIAARCHLKARISPQDSP